MYIGTQPYQGFRARHTYTATAGQTSFSGAGAENVTLTYSDEMYIDVYQNGVKLSPADYTATSGTTVVLATGATVSDIVEVIKYDAFSVADTVSAKDGGGFGGNISTSGTLAVTGTSTLTGNVTAAGRVIVDDTTDATSTTDGSLQTDGGLSVAKDAVFGDDIKLLSDSSVIHFGADSDVFLQHSHNDGLDLQRTATSGGVSFNMRTGDTDIADGNILASINASAPLEGTGTDAILVAAGIDFRAGAAFAADKNAGEIDIKCANSETAATVTTFKRHSDGSMEQINNAGTTTLRTTAAAGVYGITLLASDSNARFDISRSGTSAASMARFGNSNGFVGSITTSGTATAYNTSSDYRLKENVNYDWDGTTELKKLKPAKFNFKADTDTTVQGFLAHEVSSIVPEAIAGEKDAEDTDNNPIYQGIDQSKLVPLLVKSLQEALTEIDTLKTKVAALEGE